MQTNSEKFVTIDRTNFDEHFTELSELFGFPNLKSHSFELREISSGGIEYRTTPTGKLLNDKIFTRYGVDEYFSEHKILTKPRFYLRTHYQNGAQILLIECIGKEILDGWEQEVKKDKDFFRKNRNQIRLNNTSHDKVYWDAQERTYLRFSIKSNRLAFEQIGKLAEVFVHLFSISIVPKGEHNSNKYGVDNLRSIMEYMITKEKTA